MTDRWEHCSPPAWNSIIQKQAFGWMGELVLWLKFTLRYKWLIVSWPFLSVVLERGWERARTTTRKEIRKRRNQIEASFSFLVPNFTGPSLAREQYLPLGMQWRQVARTEDLSPGNGVIHLALYTAHLWAWARCRLRAQEVAPKYSPASD